MNNYFSFNEPVVLKPTWADLLADWYWNNRADVKIVATIFGVTVVLGSALVAVI